MITSAILDTLTSKEILTVLGVGSVTTVIAMVKKVLHTRISSGNGISYNYETACRSRCRQNRLGGSLHEDSGYFSGYQERQ